MDACRKDPHTDPQGKSSHELTQREEGDCGVQVTSRVPLTLSTIRLHLILSSLWHGQLLVLLTFYSHHPSPPGQGVDHPPKHPPLALRCPDLGRLFLPLSTSPPLRNESQFTHWGTRAEQKKGGLEGQEGRRLAGPTDGMAM